MLPSKAHSRERRYKKKIVKQKISSRHIFMDRWEKKNRGMSEREVQGIQ